MLIVPTQPIANQTLQVQLNGQACTLTIFQSNYAMFMTVAIGTALIVSNVPCQNLNRIIRDLYLGFSGDFVFLDTKGTSNPVYTGLGNRWLLIYLSPTDLANLGKVG
jgi:Domain of unknown function (DUF6983)